MMKLIQSKVHNTIWTDNILSSLIAAVFMPPTELSTISESQKHQSTFSTLSKIVDHRF